MSSKFNIAEILSFATPGDAVLLNALAKEMSVSSRQKGYLHNVFLNDAEVRYYLDEIFLVGRTSTDQRLRYKQVKAIMENKLYEHTQNLRFAWQEAQTVIDETMRKHCGPR